MVFGFLVINDLYFICGYGFNGAGDCMHFFTLQNLISYPDDTNLECYGS
jgi:hypothetical protein